MTESEKIQNLQAIVGTNESIEVCSFYLGVAGQKIIDKAYPFDHTVELVPTRYHYLQIEIAAYLMNKRGAEGQTSHSENGIVRGYTENGDIPKSLINQVTPNVGVIK